MTSPTGHAPATGSKDIGRAEVLSKAARDRAHDCEGYLYQSLDVWRESRNAAERRAARTEVRLDVRRLREAKCGHRTAFLSLVAMVHRASASTATGDVS